MITVFSQVDYPYHSDTKTFLNALKSVGTHLDIDKAKSLDGFVRDLHGEYNPNYTTYDIWSKFRALYPFIGGNAEAHKFNLINPVDSDAAYRLTFYGSPTHDDLGVLMAGALGQYAETYCWIGDLKPSGHLAYYAQLLYISEAGYIFMGDIEGVGGCTRANVISYNKGTETKTEMGIFGQANSSYPTFAWPGYPDSRSRPGLISVNRIDDSILGEFLVGNYYTTTFTSDTGVTGSNINTIKIQKGWTTGYAGPYSRCSLASIGKGFTSDEMIFFNNAIQSYQTLLGRVV